MSRAGEPSALEVQMDTTSTLNTTHPSRARLAVVCLLNAGKTAEAERYIATLPPDIAGNLGYYLAVARAQQGRVDDAVSALIPALRDDGLPRDVHAAAVELLRKQAVQKINARDWPAAGTALGEAL